MKAALAPAGPGWAVMQLGTGRYMLHVCAACSLALHAALLAVHVSPEPPKHATRTVGAPPQIVHVRLQQSFTAAPFVATVPEQTEAAQVAVAMQPAPPAEIPLIETPTPTAKMPPTAEPESPLPASTAFHLATAGERDDFVPRPLLSLPPLVLTPVILSAPPGEPTVARYLGVLSLFIDELGRVQYVTADEPRLPAAFEQAAREAFMAAQFSPGQIDGLAVKSRQRVEVVFDNTPLPVH